MEKRKYSFFKTSEGAVFMAAWIILAVVGVFLYASGFKYWGELVNMLLVGHFVGKGASIPMGINLLHNKLLAAVLVYLQDVVSLFIIFPLLFILKKKIIRNKMLEDTFDQAEKIVKEHRWIKTFGVVGVAFCVLFPFQPITGPITASVVGILIALPFWTNLFTVMITSAISVIVWTLFYGQIFEITKGMNKGLITAISVIAIGVLYLLLYFFIIRKQIVRKK